MSNNLTPSALTPVQLEHYEVARGIDGFFSARKFNQQYLKRYPNRNPSSILPSDFSFNNEQKDRERYPSFLIKLARSRYRFVGRDYKYNYASDIGDLSRSNFERAYENLNRNLSAYNGSEFEGFETGVIHCLESYKDDIRKIALERLNSDAWTKNDIGSGRVLSALIDAIEIRENEIHNNLVDWEPRPNQPSLTMQLRDDVGSAKKQNQFERMLFDLIRGQTDHETALTRLVELIGRRYSLIAYIFFLIDDTQYMPISSQTLDRAFDELGIDLQTSGECSWDNYAAYIEAIGWVRDALIGWKGFTDTRLLDAHSWICLMARLPGKIDQLPNQGISNRDEIKFKMIELGRNIINRVAVANGQSEKSVVKNKEVFGFTSDQALHEFLVELWKKQKGICNLTGLPMQLRVEKGIPNHMIVSVDRIDSDRHYSPDNLQLTCWFANRWKGTTPNEEFIDLLNRIREDPQG